MLAISLVLLVTGTAMIRSAISLPARVPEVVDWIALIAAAVAVVVSLWDRRARYTAAGLYALALTAVIMGQVQRGYWPGAYFLWGALCEWSGLMIVCALVGWSFRRFRFAGALFRIPDRRRYWPDTWFHIVQAVVAAVTAALILWISLDTAFDAMGSDVALFGLSGHMACCPAALMLLGSSILMAWQAGGARRAMWQYAAMASGVLFTTSVAWARLDVGSATAQSLWFDRSVNLLISTAMMTLLTRLGLARVLPRSGDWITRARRAAPVFGSIALLLLAAILLQKCL
jgi:hypothetical protein